MFQMRHTGLFCQLLAKDKFRLHFDVIINAVMAGQKPAAKGPHVPHDGDVMSRQLQKFFI